MFSAAVLDHTLNPRHEGPMDGASHYGQAGDPGGGPYVQLWFLVEGDRILRGAYRTYGCPAAVACASLVAEILVGKTTTCALAIDARDIDHLLGGLPEGKGHCPAMVVDALRQALSEESHAQ